MARKRAKTWAMRSSVRKKQCPWRGRGERTAWQGNAETVRDRCISRLCTSVRVSGGTLYACTLRSHELACRPSAKPRHRWGSGDYPYKCGWEFNQHTTNHQVAQLPPPIRDIPPSGWCPISVSQSGSQFGWFGGASRGTPKPKVPNEILKVKMGVHHTRTFLLI